ncbi:MAG TPA: aminoglycoside phosphotransferase family protein [Cyclobacteriaceae bacterium]|jgi:Ser/Thr protein kinase RdoA (MazF antagonist)|nr:aminoglycoside phosphotransferase family protein [Cyclobacteriaceae bacterium]
MTLPEDILKHFGIDGVCSPLGSGHIHKTFKVSGKKNFVLQRVNKNVFTKPEIIASNNRIAFEFFQKKHPEYTFPQPRPTKKGDDLHYDDDGFPWRVFPLIENTFTIDEVSSEQDAFEAAKGFGSLTKNLQGVDVSLFQPTLERFHDLAWRYEQFEDALRKAKSETMATCENEIAQAKSFEFLAKEYTELIKKNQLVLSVMHNDTKVNNILFDLGSRKAVCAIDLDTLMPGYFIYDLGDMVRTFVSPVSEEEKDISKVQFRKNIYDSLLKGYLSEMEKILTPDEKKSIPFAGKMMTYIMALRMLADFLRGNTYYQITYPTQNLVRARNQFRLLELIVAST